MHLLDTATRLSEFKIEENLRRKLYQKYNINSALPKVPYVPCPAREEAKRLGIPEFKGSDSWLTKFKARHGI